MARNINKVPMLIPPVCVERDIVVAMLPGPDNKGMASGVSDISVLVIDSSLPWSLRFADLSVPLSNWNPDRMTMSPPAILRLIRLNPKNDMINVPASKKKLRIMTTYMQAFRAMSFRYSGVCSVVSARNTGIMPSGFTTENNEVNEARKLFSSGCSKKRIWIKASTKCYIYGQM